MMYIRSLKTGQELEAERKGLKKQVYCGKGVLSTPETQAMYIPRIRSDIRDPAGQPASPLLIGCKKISKSRLNDILENGSARLNFPDAGHLPDERLHLVGFLGYLLVLGTRHHVSYSNPKNSAQRSTSVEPHPITRSRSFSGSPTSWPYTAATGGVDSLLAYAAYLPTTA